MTHDGTVPGRAGHRLDRMTTVQAREAMENASVALIPVGATEQHGPNLVCGIDWMTAEAVAERVAAAVDPLAVMVPPLPFGLSGHHLDFPGTLHVSAATFSAVCKDVARSLARHGIRKVVFVNGHRGNENVLGVLVTELTYELGIEAASAFWMTQAAEEIGRHKKTPRWGHACEIETSLAMAISGDLVAQELVPGDLIEDYGAYEDNYKAHSLVTARTFASRTRNGAFGDATLATVDAGREILDAAVTRTAAFVRDFAARAPRGGRPEGGAL
jgi:creatinine amidohydrolase